MISSENIGKARHLHIRQLLFTFVTLKQFKKKEMKKTLLALAAVVAVLLCASCSKTCNCKAYGSAAGYSADYDGTITLEQGQKCSDFNQHVGIAGVEAGVKCTPQLF